ncbi:c-type cytochrome [Falsiroseomonas sp.]|uniref:c-type cytochrome n=1 Tax=Falsiroseomonas sp. TaxID=2870721 RepID=UPI003562D1F6
MLLSLLAAAVMAAAFSGAAVAQDARRGAELAAHSCGNCHGADGRSQMADIPSLAGQPAGYVTVQLILFREGIRQVPAMLAFAANMPDKDVEDLAAYYASLPPGPPDDRGPREDALFAAGRAVAEARNCGVCHLPGFAGREQVPRLAAQREEYLVRAMTEYRDGNRVGVDSQMNGAVFGLSNADLAALAHYLSHLD